MDAYTAAGKALHEQAIATITANIKDCDKLAAAMHADTESTRPTRIEMARFEKAHPEAAKSDADAAAAQQKDLEKRAPLDACKTSKPVTDAIAEQSLPAEQDKINAALAKP